MAGSADVLKERKRAHEYSYGRSHVPRDATSENIQTGHFIDGTAMECGLFFEIVSGGPRELDRKRSVLSEALPGSRYAASRWGSRPK